MPTVALNAGNAAQFNTLIAAQAFVEGVVVTLGAATYTSTLGATAGVPWHGWQFVGASAATVTIKVGALSANGFGYCFRSQANRVAFSGITFDGNYTAMHAAGLGLGHAGCTTEAVELPSGTGGHVVRDCAITDFASERGTEGFPILLVGDGCRIERVTATNWRGGSCTALAVAAGNGLIANCAVSGGYQIGYGGWDLRGAQFIRNTQTGGDYGFNCDSLHNRGVLIADNTFNANLWGLTLGSPSSVQDVFDRFRIERNTFVIPAGQQGIRLNSDVRRAIVRRNTFTGTTGYALLQQGSGHDRNQFIGNAIGGSLATENLTAGNGRVYQLLPEGA